MASKIEEISLGLSRLRRIKGRLQYQAAVLVLETYIPGAGGVRSWANVYWVGQKGSRTHEYGMGTPPTRDFSKEMVYDRAGLPQQDAVDGQFAGVFIPDAVAELTAQARDHYASRYTQATGRTI